MNESTATPLGAANSLPEIGERRPRRADSVEATPRPEVCAARRVVVKVGTRVLLGEDGRLDRPRLTELVATLAGLRQGGKDVLLVSSGAVGVGRGELGPSAFDPGAEACAAVGQTLLIGAYHRLFERFGLTCGQVLLAQRDFDDRSRAVKLAATLGTLLRQGVVPILNENDTIENGQNIVTDQGTSRSFSDNDRLAALVAGLMGADLLVVLTDVEGVCDRDPRLFEDASLLATYDVGRDSVLVSEAVSGSPGRGGMGSKLSSAEVAARGGCGVVIASGRQAGSLSRLLGGESIGTWIPPCGQLPARDRWIAFSAVARGFLRLDHGAVLALRERGASLLASGVVEVGGRFTVGDVIDLRDEGGSMIGRARIRHAVDSVQRWVGEATRGVTLIRRSDIVLIQKGTNP